MAARAKPATPLEPRRGALQVGGQTDLVKLLFGRPEFGIFFLVILVTEAALFLVFIVSSASVERILALIGFFLLLGGTLWFFGRMLPMLVPGSVVPGSLVADAIAPQEAERRADLVSLTAPDATFTFGADLPPNWSYDITTLVADTAKRLRGNRLGTAEPEELEVMLPYGAGELVVFSEAQQTHIDYAPGRSMMNGRFTLGAVTEVLTDQILMFSISKHGSRIRDVTAEHVFAEEVGTQAGNGLRLMEIKSEASETTGRARLTARAMLELKDVVVDGTPGQNVAVEARLYVVERASFIYMIKAIHLPGARGAAARRAQADAIINSFQPVSPANAEERGRRDQMRADGNFDRVMRDLAPKILASKADQVLREVVAPGVISVSDRQLKDLETLSGYADAFPALVESDLRDRLALLADAAGEARRGVTDPLARLLGLVPPDPSAEPEDAKPGAP